MAGASAAGAESFSAFFAASCPNRSIPPSWQSCPPLSARDLSTRRCLPPKGPPAPRSGCPAPRSWCPVPPLRPGRGRQTRPAFAPDSSLGSCLCSSARLLPNVTFGLRCLGADDAAGSEVAPGASARRPTTRCPPRPHPPTSRSPRPARCPGCWRSPRRCPAQPRVHRPDPHTGRTRRFVPHVAGRVLELGSHRLLVSNLTERTVCNPDHMCLPGKNHQNGSRGELSRRGMTPGDQSRQASARNAGTSNASARPRCDTASFSAGLSSAADRSDPTGTNTGS